MIGSSSNSLRDNRTDNNSQSGISVQGATDGTDSNNNVLTGNTAPQNGWFGIDIGYFSAIIDGDLSSAASSNTLKGSTANQNAISGFGVFGDSSLNLFQGNRARTNATYDALDDSTSSSNTWTNNNFGTTSGI